MSSEEVEAGRVVKEFRAPDERLRARKAYLAFHVFALALLGALTYHFYTRADLGGIAVSVGGAAVVGTYGLYMHRRLEGLAGASMTDRGVILLRGGKHGSEGQFVHYDEILGVRVEGWPQSLRLYTLVAADGRKFKIDGWIEHEFLDHLRRHLGERWEAVYSPRKGKYPIWPPPWER